MNICIFGDSIVWGACDYERGGWVERLKTYLLKNNNDVDVYNFGVSGNTTEDLLVRFEREVTIMKPDAIVFAIGINDSQYLDSRDNSKIEPGIFQNNIQSLFDKAKNMTNKIIFIGLTKVDQAKTMPRVHGPKIKYYENEIIRKYDQVISDVCKKNGIPFVSVIELLNVGDFEDGLHPNSSGHTKMFEKIKPEVEKLLANLK